VSLLAAFAFEKAVIADHLHLKGIPFFRFADRDRSRESLAIPAGVIRPSALKSGEPYSYKFF
jgi:hypothetical protein